MSQLIVDLTNEESMQMAMSIISAYMTGDEVNSSPAEDLMHSEVEVDSDTSTEVGDDLASMLGDDSEPSGPTFDDLKATIKAYVEKKGSEKANEFIKKIMAKLSVKKLNDVPEDKYESVITILNKAIG